MKTLKTGALLLTTLLLSCSTKKSQDMPPVSTIDPGIQSFAEKALRSQMDSTEASAGAVAIMETSTGNILAWVDVTEKGPSPDDSSLLCCPTEPGTLFLPVSMMIAMDASVVEPDDTIDTESGNIMLEGEFIRDHNFARGGYGPIAAYQVISLSSNVGMAKIVHQGYDGKEGAFLKRAATFRWNNSADAGKGDAFRVLDTGCSKKNKDVKASIGYGIAVKPIALLGFYNAIANDGKMVESRRYSTQESPVILKKRICYSHTLMDLHTALTKVTENGTGQIMKTSSIHFAGKTGRAMSRDQNGQMQVIVSFCGFFPAEAPRYSCIVLLKNPKNGIPSGGRMAGCVFKSIGEWLCDKPRNLD